jgi:hypothetical protein
MQGEGYAALSEVEVRQEASFVLWAPRCCALERERYNIPVIREIRNGFELADASETLVSFWEFARSLCQAAASRVTWHGPACG